MYQASIHREGCQVWSWAAKPSSAVQALPRPSHGVAAHPVGPAPAFPAAPSETKSWTNNLSVLQSPRQTQHTWEMEERWVQDGCRADWWCCSWHGPSRTSLQFYSPCQSSQSKLSPSELDTSCKPSRQAVSQFQRLKRIFFTREDSAESVRIQDDGPMYS